MVLRLHRARIVSLVRSAAAQGVACPWRAALHHSSLPLPHRQPDARTTNDDLDFPDDFEDVGGPAEQLKALETFV